jgi:hypothetical protein
MSLEPKDLEILERMLYKNAEDIFISITRGCERLVERVDAAESRIYSRMAEVDDRVEGARQENVDILTELKEEIREGARLREESRLD